ncbi:MAG: chemotaxis protein CheB, partial [Planctomycetia bacterium]|nr:chemotaxis protein CheB [Planctomycetia bacterium]
PASPRLTRPIPRLVLAPGGHTRPQAVFVAVSTGGPKALDTLLPELCQQVELPILVVQHFPPGFTQFLAENLQRHCPHQVVEASDGERVQPRHVYIAPIGKHLLVRRGADGQVLTALNEQPPENGFRPSADVLFRAAATVYGAAAVALVLTGMGSDGSAGLGPLKRAGAHVIAQDEASSVVWGMPSSAVATGLVDEVLPLERIPEAIAGLLKS